MFINDVLKHEKKVGMMCTDIFSKYMVVVPLMSKQPADISRTDGMYEKRDEKPKLIYIP